MKIVGALQRNHAPKTGVAASALGERRKAAYYWKVRSVLQGNIMRPTGWILLGTLTFVAFAVWSESVAANEMKPATARSSQSAVTTRAAPSQQTATPGIAIVSGTWGANCGARRGNATRNLARHCNGLLTCGYVLDARATGSVPSPARGALPSGRNTTSLRACRADYRAQWRCGSHEFHDAALSAGASPGDTLILSCVHESGPGH
ncbi:MAG TPA: hypothetical protein VJS30_10475 [Paraburkholderia sp.]|nr:hypothetical protein [Paraburkholderia sp.]